MPRFGAEKKKRKERACQKKVVQKNKDRRKQAQKENENEKQYLVFGFLVYDARCPVFHSQVALI